MLTFFAYIRDENRGMIVRRIPLARELQQRLSESFIRVGRSYLPEDSGEIFDFLENVDYKPREGELLSVRTFRIPQEIIDAIDAPINIDRITSNEYEAIKSIFCGERLSDGTYKIMFTGFDARKIIYCEETLS